MRDDEKHKIGKAIKILKQYKRLTQKYQVNISIQRQQELDDMINSGSIKSSNLPAKLYREFPAEYKELTLSELENLFRHL
ncbi:hypothetical protein [Pseudanabaena sp. ABRG5-3]|uniref:hypothetical protein n=1 Tax=Pseudanabaena sp. ABRG5-3 TaxID=685565 RepID=UPI000DC714FF|nr:hypothetical protein [Pseudanabaena sp. ABRG5-3]BBC25009.1 hypothetical protein ABRG53_2752 [Pseudanabaena sp. ABRG5-3]